MPPLQERSEIEEIVKRAKQGDTTSLPQLREWMARYPSLWSHYGNLAAHVEQSWIVLASGKNLYLQEALTRFAVAQRAELMRPGGVPVEKLLIERVV